MYACKKKTMGDCVSLLCPVCWDHVCEFARVGQVRMCLPETLCELVCCVCVCVMNYVDACKRKSIHVCECLFCLCV